jgi:DivIVA domain-containing protein
MQGFSRDDIIAHRFTTGRRKGYDTVEVDSYLERLAEYVGWMQTELAKHEAPERGAIDVLLQAQRVADETVAAAERDAEKLGRNAATGLENARQDARTMLDAARADADRTLLSARVQAEAELERGRTQLAELEAARAARQDEFNQLVEDLRSSAAGIAAQFRSAGSRLAEMADHVEFELAAQRDELGQHDNESVERNEERVEVP